MPNITDVGARLVLTGRTEFTGGIDAAKKSILDLARANDDGAKSATTASRATDTQAASVRKAAAEAKAAADMSDKVTAAKQREAKANQDLVAAQAEYEASMQMVMPVEAEAVASADRQVAALDRLKAAEAEAATAAQESARVQADAAAQSSAAAKTSADEKVAANDRVGASSASSGALSKTALLGIIAAGVGVGYESVKMATGFETQMTRLSTAAGLPIAVVDENKQAVIDLGTQVGFTGTQMAEALYHPVSAGLDMATSLNVVRDAAKEAQISGANLDDTTYSLSSVMKAFNLNADDSTQTMSTLNSIVGQGDMHFQDFNTSIKGWAAPAATFGVSIQSVGAALAYMADRGVPAAQGGTQLGMSMALMAAPTKQATKILTDAGMAASDVSAAAGPMTDLLQKAGVTTTQMADDMKKPDGIQVALADLKQHMIDGGVTADEQAAVISRAFGGGKSGKAIMEMYNNLDGLQQKYDAIGAGSTPEKFADAWAQTQKTTQFHIDALKSSFANFGIQLGEALLPWVNRVISGFTSFFGWMSEHQGVMTATAVIIGGVLAGAFAALAVSVIAATWPFLLIGGAIAGLVAGFLWLWNNVEGFRNFFKTAWEDIKAVALIVWPYIRDAAEATFTWIKNAISTVVDFVREHWSTIKTIAEVVFGAVVAIVAGPIIAIGALIYWVVQQVRDHWTEIVTIASTVWQKVTSTVGSWIEGIKQFVAPLVQFFAAHMDEIKQVVLFIWGVIKTLTQVAWVEISAVLSIAWGIIKGVFDAVAPLVLGIVTILWNAIKTVTQAVWDIILGVLRIVWDGIVGVLKVARDIFIGIFSVFLDVVTGHWSQAWADIQTFLHNIWDDITGMLSSQLGAFKDMFLGVLNDLATGLEHIWGAIWDTAKATFVGGINGVIDLINGFLGAINTIAGAVGLDLNLHINPIGQPAPAAAPISSAGGLQSNPMATGRQGLAEGGLLRGPGSGTSDSILGVDDRGVPTARVSNGEFVTKESSTKKYLPLLQAINSDTLGAIRPLPNGAPGTRGSGLPGYATGGPVAAPSAAVDAISRAISFAQSQNGKPYQLGGPTGPDSSFDCSGFMGSIAATINGTDPWHRYWSTEDGGGWKGQGFQPGLGAGFSIGILHGGDAGGHTAGTLGGFGGIAPVNVESGGVHNNVEIGGNAAGADNPEFTEQWHLPIVGDAFQSAGMGGGGGGSWVQHIAAGALAAAWPVLPTPANLLGIFPAAANKIRQSVIDFVSGKDMARGGGNVGGGSGAIPTGEHLQLINEALSADGIPQADWPRWEAGLDTLITRESGWNAFAVNNTDSNAMAGTPSTGLMQTIGPTFESYRNPTLPDQMTNPVSNIAAGVNYIKGSYGDIANVQQANPNLPPQGYYLGGLVGALEARMGGGPVAHGTPYLVGEAGPEIFVPDAHGQIVPNKDIPADPARPGGNPFGGFGTTVHVHEGAIVIHESGDPQATYEAVKRGIADEVARR